ncbi:MAG: pyruvate dehydrogenase complex dihydrolipoamide acetyltransferase [Gemmatimonadetes bacterium]|nr:pyruvate dehydrogenase complex dihydrolipoamide acetyltransferase [Gemmatimonadota bacterium]
MATKVHMEALSPTMEEGQVVKWHKAEGDVVSQGQLLAEIETDKATMELIARGDGVLRKILKREGETAPVGDVIAVIAAEGEDISALVGAAGGNGAATEAPKSKSDHKIEAAPPAAPPAQAARAAAPAAQPAARPARPVGDSAPAAEGGRLKASPLAKRLAREAGVELTGLRGSGPGGRIVKRDVEEAAERAPAPAAAPAWSMGGPDFEDLKVSQMRKTIARRLTESLAPVPHFFLTVDVDMDRAQQARSRINGLLESRNEKISLNDLVIRAAASALRQHPAVNSAWMGDHIRRHNRVHIGVAVAVEDGLITPIIRDADRKGVAEIAREVRELAGRAREKKLKPDEYTGSTFSISNLGMFGIQEFTGIINPPEAAILAVGQVQETAVVMGGQVVVRPRMKVTMSCDHRAIDGATGARFLQTLQAMLEEPASILL